MEENIRQIKARVIATGQIVEVDDHPIWFGFVRIYNPTHIASDGTEYEDEELEFLEPRLQQYQQHYE